MLAEQGEKVRLRARRHGVVLARPLARGTALAAVGMLLVLAGWPLSVAGAGAAALAALLVFRAVWAWHCTQVVVTTEKLFVVYGTLRRRAAAVRLGRVGAVEVEQSLLGRLLGYGTLVAGELEISYVARPRDLCRLLG